MRGCAAECLVIAAIALLLPFGAQAAIDHGQRAWTLLLQKHVALVDGGKASRVDYRGLVRERAALKAYLEELSGATESEFRGWSGLQQMAFLINAYNAFTVEKVLTRYPGLDSIRDFGRIFGNPFQDRFFVLLGQPFSLDRIEHEMLRKPGSYDDVRVHYALNCASVGCPMLREEAYVAERLDGQLEQQAQRFLSDRSCNRYAPAAGALEVSRIYDWYAADWSRGARPMGSTEPSSSLRQYFARYAPLLSDDPEQRRRIAAQQAEIRFLEYDWRLNDTSRSGGGSR